MNRVLFCFFFWTIVMLSIQWASITAKSVISPDENIVFQKDTVAGNDAGLVFTIVEDMPVFGEKATQKKNEALDPFQKYVNDHVVYPANATKSKKIRRVFVQFEVDRQGDVVDVKVIRGVEPALDAEAIRVVSSSPRWTPGHHKGKPVRVRFVILVEFKAEIITRAPPKNNISVLLPDG